MAPRRKNRASDFSYRCQGCGTCCHHKSIQINPFELLHLARGLGLSTTEVIADYMQAKAPYLLQQPGGACIFLANNTCSVHQFRPTVCRIYPLGRLHDQSGAEYFVEIPPAKGSKGIFGGNRKGSATIADFINAQEIDSYFEAAAKCLALQHKIVASLNSDRPLSIPAGFGDAPLDWIDVDKVLALGRVTLPRDAIAAKLDAYLHLISRWVDTAQNHKGDDHDSA